MKVSQLLEATTVAKGERIEDNDMGELYKAGLHFLEKPYWAELDEPRGKYKPWTAKDVQKAEAVMGHKFERFKGAEIFTRGKNPESATGMGYIKHPEFQTAIIEWPDNTRYVIETSGANTYCRFWAKIAD